MALEVAIVNSVEAIGQAEWDRLSGQRPFASYRWYRYGEAVLSDDTPAHVIVYNRGHAVARATFWVTRQEPLPLASKAARRLLEAFFRRWPLVVCRSPLAETSGLILPEPDLCPAALRLITQAMREFARRQHASFVFFDYLGRSDMQAIAASTDLVPLAITDPGTHLALTWPSFDDYLRHLAKSVRRHYRQTVRHTAEQGITVTAHARVTAIEEALRLIRNVEARHNSAPRPWAQAMLENLPLIDGVWMAAEQDGRLVGCELLVGDGDTWLMTLLGLDYRLRHVYFLLGYEDIRRALEHGVRVLRGGSGAYAEKRRLGFQIEDQNHISLAALDPALHRLLRWGIAR